MEVQLSKNSYFKEVEKYLKFIFSYLMVQEMFEENFSKTTPKIYGQMLG